MFSKPVPGPQMCSLWHALRFKNLLSQHLKTGLFHLKHLVFRFFWKVSGSGRSKPAFLSYSGWLQLCSSHPFREGPLALSKCMLFFFYFAEAHLTQFHKLPDACGNRACDQSFVYETLIFSPQTLWISIWDREHLQISIGEKGYIHLMEKGLVNKLEEHENRKGAKEARWT